MDLTELVVNCAVALITFMLGWILPQPQRLIRAIAAAVIAPETQKKEKP